MTDIPAPDAPVGAGTSASRPSLTAKELTALSRFYVGSGEGNIYLAEFWVPPQPADPDYAIPAVAGAWRVIEVVAPDPASIGDVVRHHFRIAEQIENLTDGFRAGEPKYLWRRKADKGNAMLAAEAEKNKSR